MIRFQCKTCQQKIKIEDKYANRNIKCPRCKRVQKATNQNTDQGQQQSDASPVENKVSFATQKSKSHINKNEGRDRAGNGETEMNDDPIAQPMLAPSSCVSMVKQDTSEMNKQTPPLPKANLNYRDIWRYKWSIFLIFILVSAPIVYGIWKFTIPEYQAHGEIRVQPIVPYFVFRTEDSGQIPLYESYMNTQVSLMRSINVLMRVLDRQEVKETQWFTVPKQSVIQKIKQSQPDLPLERLRAALTVFPRARTEVIDADFLSENGQEAELILNAVLDEYIKYIAEINDSSDDAIFRKLNDEYKKSDEEIRGLETSISKIQAQLGTNLPEQLIAAKRLRLDQTQADLKAIQNEIVLLKWQEQHLTKTISDPDPNDLTGTTLAQESRKPKYYEDEEWRSLDIQLRTARHDVETAKKRFAETNLEMTRYHDEVKFAEDLMRVREKQLDELWENRSEPQIVSETGDPVNTEISLQMVSSQLARKRQEEILLHADYNSQKEECNQIFLTASMLEQEQRALNHKRSFFASVRDRLEQKSMERNVPGSISILTQATASSAPVKDRRFVFSVMALFMGLALGCSVAYFRLLTYQKINTPVEIISLSQTPFLGHIPIVKTAALEKNKTDLFMNECVRMVRTAVLMRLGANETGKSILISSASEGTGKTSVTTILGRSLAQIGKKVLLLDADLRTKSLTRKLGYDDKPGLIESLKFVDIQKSCIYATDTPGLDIMPAGQNFDRIELEKMANGVFLNLIDNLRTFYDIILLDGTPLLPVADARIQASLVDGTILVEREKQSQRMGVLDALEILKSSGGHLMGTIFINNIKNRKSYYNYGYNSIRERRIIDGVESDNAK
jgi:polysaccharide biosynthesis transport protein